nr:uncharacterized protein LOC111751266 [Loxodonta africana]
MRSKTRVFGYVYQNGVVPNDNVLLKTHLTATLPGVFFPLNKQPLLILIRVVLGYCRTRYLEASQEPACVSPKEELALRGEVGTGIGKGGSFEYAESSAGAGAQGRLASSGLPGGPKCGPCSREGAAALTGGCLPAALCGGPCAGDHRPRLEQGGAIPWPGEVDPQGPEDAVLRGVQVEESPVVDLMVDADRPWQLAAGGGAADLRGELKTDESVLTGESENGRECPHGRVSGGDESANLHLHPADSSHHMLEGPARCW